MAIGVIADGNNVVLVVTSGYCESMAAWSGLLREKSVGMIKPRLLGVCRIGLVSLSNVDNIRPL